MDIIDLFAGIGGIRLGVERNGATCVYTCEQDKFCQQTYLANFPNHTVVNNIKDINAADIPDHDILLAGFPCQPFSLAGVSKRNALGYKQGFECPTQGTLFFYLANIIDEKRPKAFLLENVRNLLHHDKGNTFKIIMHTLQQLGYELHYKVIDGQHFVPQHRERIFIVGFRHKTEFSWDNLQLPTKGALKLSTILHPQDGSEKMEEPYTQGNKATVNSKYTLSPKLWAYLQAYKEKHIAKGNGFGYSLVDGNAVSRTLSARYYKDGSEILIAQKERPRRLTPRECARLMGFPANFAIPVSDTQAYKQFGNSVVVPLIAEITKMILTEISK